MAPTGDLRRLGMAAALVFLAATSVGAAGIVLWDWQTPKLPTESAEKRKKKWPIYCYDVSNVQRKLNCSYSLELRYDPPDPLAIAWNGGHLHSEGRESSKLAMGDLTCDRFVSKTDTSCVGFTEGTIVNVTHEIPEVSGILTTRITQTFPPGWVCADFSECDDETHRTWFLTLYTSIGIPGLVELPSDPEIYVRCADTATCGSVDNDDQYHPKPFFGTSSIVAAVKELAKKFHSLHPGRRLRLTDMSLPAGGLFDFRETWAPPHQSHRTGVDLDVAKEVAVESGGKEPLNDDDLDVLACDFTLNRHEKKEDLIHYRLEPCPAPAPTANP